MAIHENLQKVPKQQLWEVGWSKAIELVKLVRNDREALRRKCWPETVGAARIAGLPKTYRLITFSRGANLGPTVSTI
jgi:hypothetical protein